MIDVSTYFLVPRHEGCPLSAVPSARHEGIGVDHAEGRGGVATLGWPDSSSYASSSAACEYTLFR
jgi:hypothetical protein